LRFMRQNPPSSDFAEDSLSNCINYWGAAQKQGQIDVNRGNWVYNADRLRVQIQKGNPG